MATSQAPYTYTPLRVKPNEMRLLKLLPGAADEEILIEIIHVEASSTPAYEALSYVWGTSGHTHQVTVTQTTIVKNLDRGLRQNLLTWYHLGQQVQHCNLAIGSNLFVALKQLRRNDKARMLWIDAICINQDDLAERSKEVGKMAEIYSCAKHVLVWLGEESSDSALAISEMRALGESLNFKYEGLCAIIYFKEGLEPSTRRRFDEQEANTMSSTWRAISNLYNREWFTRLWVFQEIQLASSATVLVGPSQLDWELFRRAMLFTQIKGQGWLAEYFRDGNLEKLACFVFPISGIPKNIVWLCYISNHAHCLDARDRIYAFLSLMNPATAALITPDYSLPVEEVYTQAVIAEIKYTKILSILELEYSMNETNSTTCPSWVPDFSKFRSRALIAGAFATGKSDSDIQLDNGRRILRVRGRVLDSISQVSTPITQDVSIYQAIEICQEWESTNPTTRYVAGGNLSTAFIQAISHLYCWGILQSGNEWPTMQDLMTEYQSAVRENALGSEPSQFSCQLYKFLRERMLFRTKKGYIGVCSSSARVGDQVAVVLGCNPALILRNVPGLEDSFATAGPCYVVGLMNAEGLLGPLPQGWNYSVRPMEGYFRLLFCDPNNEETQLDPRAGPLPLGWRNRFGLENYDAQIQGNYSEPEEASTKKIIWFENVETGEMDINDPRLRSEHLTSMGIQLQEINLV